MLLFFVALFITVLAALSLGLAGLATFEHRTVIQSGHHAQLTQIVQSGIDAAAKAIDDTERPDLVDNPERFCSIEVVPAWMSRSDFGAGRFTVFSPRLEQDQVRGVRFGLTRESPKLSLESILAWEIESPGQGTRALEKLPGMTTEISDSILDWLDADDNPRPQGAEVDYYKQQQKSYRPRNAVPIALEELLFIRGVQRSLVFGEDHQLTFGAKQSTLRNNPALPFMTDPFAVQPFEPLDSPGLGDASAWQFLLTPYSAEKLVNAQNVVRIFLNESDLEFLESQLRLHQLEEETVQFILTWRRNRGNIADQLDLLDAEIIVAGETITSPFSCSDAVKYEQFLRLLDEAVTQPAIVLRGRINVNEAPRPVLEAIPELTPELVTAILDRRQPGATTQRHAVWLLAEEILDKAMMRTLSRRLTTGGDVYRIQVAGFFENKPMFHRAEAVLDATVKPPRVVFYKPLTPLGFPE
jgi:type II secretory pathway component PulK